MPFEHSNHDTAVAGKHWLRLHRIWYRLGELARYTEGKEGLISETAESCISRAIIQPLIIDSVFGGPRTCDILAHMEERRE